MTIFEENIRITDTIGVLYQQYTCSSNYRKWDLKAALRVVILDLIKEQDLLYDLYSADLKQLPSLPDIDLVFCVRYDTTLLD
jgi:hypothetical protein